MLFPLVLNCALIVNDHTLVFLLWEKFLIFRSDLICFLSAAFRHLGGIFILQRPANDKENFKFIKITLSPFMKVSPKDFCTSCILLESQLSRLNF